MPRKSYAFVLRSRSACHLPEGKRLEITVSQQSNTTLERLVYTSEYYDHKPQWLRSYVECSADSIETAVSDIGTLVGADLQYLAVASNSMIAWPEFQVACERTKKDELGEYAEEARSPTLAPPVGYRLLDPQIHLQVAEEIRNHRYRETICQVSSLYATALELLDHRNNLLPAELAYIAAEHLARLLLERMEKEEHLPKKQIAVRLGLTGIRARGNGLRDEIAVREIYKGDRALYERHKAMSEGFEHGYGVFSEIRSSSTEIVHDVLSLVREALIRQLSLPQASFDVLLSDKARKPLAGWLPHVHLAGDWRPKVDNADTEAFLAGQRLEQKRNGAICFTDLTLNNDSYELKGGNNAPFPAEVTYREHTVSMPSDGKAKISNLEVRDQTVTKHSSDGTSEQRNGS